jgi:redox-sensitive bicupin YhaK (pirin superfamily)
MQSWNLKTPAENGSGGPRQLFSTPETRMDVIDLARNEELCDPGTGRRVVIQVFSGRIDLTIGDGTTTCDDATLVALEPGEAHLVRALEQSRLLLTFGLLAAPQGHIPGWVRLRRARSPRAQA